ncbi:hypothetical protein [Streptomyces sp. NPDC091278]|uniref:hypothetical protein n=1 Tax=Streptomyces sp. NPDC091278 TaxID=3155301 RepID=UPI00344C453C
MPWATTAVLPVTHLLEHQMASGRLLWREGTFGYTTGTRESAYARFLDHAADHAASQADSRLLLTEALDRLRGNTTTAS